VSEVSGHRRAGTPGGVAAVGEAGPVGRGRRKSPPLRSYPASGSCPAKWCRNPNRTAGISPLHGGGLPDCQLAWHRGSMTDHLEVRLVDGRVVTEPGVGPVAMVWLPLDGQVIAKIPARKGNRCWLHETVRIRSPQLNDDRWTLPRSCLTRLVTATVDRYGFIVLWRDISKLSRCTRACLEATGSECDGSCLGAHHGQDSGAWFERVGDAVVADFGECTRTAVVYGARGSDVDAVVYHGELAGERYRADRAGRRNWPTAAQFMCSGCLSVRATVWDHCHTHGFVRAPLCNRCNTRHWTGWMPQHGRAAPIRNLDDSYYHWCPRNGDAWRPCSA
jgi:hypothetical protein